MEDIFHEANFIFYDWLLLLYFMQGSARQLFQRLQGPMEEDTLKSHFEKIILIGKKQHYRRSQVHMWILEYIYFIYRDPGVFVVLRTNQSDLIN